MVLDRSVGGALVNVATSRVSYFKKFKLTYRVLLHLNDSQLNYEGTGTRHLDIAIPRRRWNSHLDGYEREFESEAIRLGVISKQKPN
jgi:hypothetical protein